MTIRSPEEIAAIKAAHANKTDIVDCPLRNTPRCLGTCGAKFIDNMKKNEKEHPAVSLQLRNGA
jgi:hypothetical protein